MSIHVSIKGIELFREEMESFFLEIDGVAMGRQLYHLLIVLDGLFIIFFLGIKIAEVHVGIGKDGEFFLHSFFSF